MLRHWKVGKELFSLWNHLRKGDEHRGAIGISQTLGLLKGPLLKMAQLTAMVPDLLPAAYREAFEGLYNHAPPMGWPFVKRRMKQAFGEDWQKKFIDFEETPRFAASLGQVHHSFLEVKGNLQRVACKLQYPGMEKVLFADMKHLQYLLNHYKSLLSGVELEALLQELKHCISLELEYLQEERSLRIFRIMLEPFPEVQVPRTYEQSRGDVLVMEWMEGDSLYKADLSQERRDYLGGLLFQAWYLPFFQYGFLHGDPHRGNVLWNDRGVTILDFGCVRLFTPEFVYSTRQLYLGVKENSMEKLLEGYEGWGFTNLTRETLEILNGWARFLFTPFLQDRRASLEELQNIDHGKQLLQQLLQKTRMGNTIAIPKSFLVMHRVAVVLGSLLMDFGTRLNWHRTWEDLLLGFSLEACGKNQTFILSME